MTDDPVERTNRVMEAYEDYEKSDIAPMIEQALNERLWIYTRVLFDELEGYK